MGVLPKLAHGQWSGVVPHGPPVVHLRIVLLLQQRVHLRHLLLLLMPLGRILHVSMNRVLDLTSADF